MKTGKIILIVTAGVFLSLTVLVLLTLRSDMKLLIESNAVRQYQSYETGSFSKISSGSCWQITVRQGNRHKLEISSDENVIRPLWDLTGETLVLGVEPDSAKYPFNDPVLFARITLPYLELIEARGNTRIDMKNYWSDSLTVRLYENAQFTGKNNDFTLLRFKTAKE